MEPWNDVIQGISRVTAVCAFVTPFLKDFLTEAVFGDFFRNQFCAMNCMADVTTF